MRYHARGCGMLGTAEREREKRIEKRKKKNGQKGIGRSTWPARRPTAPQRRSNSTGNRDPAGQLTWKRGGRQPWVTGFMRQAREQVIKLRRSCGWGFFGASSIWRWATQDCKCCIDAAQWGAKQDPESMSQRMFGSWELGGAWGQQGGPVLGGGHGGGCDWRKSTTWRRSSLVPCDCWRPLADVARPRSRMSVRPACGCRLFGRLARPMNVWIGGGEGERRGKNPRFQIPSRS